MAAETWSNTGRARARALALALALAAKRYVAGDVEGWSNGEIGKWGIDGQERGCLGLILTK